MTKEEVNSKFKKAIESLLDEVAADMFPSEGIWYSNCFSRPNEIEEINLPCHLRDENWMAELMIKKYKLNSIGKDIIVEYMTNSSFFKKIRHEYEQRIVLWQINWMYSGGENWICEDDLYIFSSRCDEIFRNGIVDTLSAIGIDSEAIEEGIEKNIDKWREKYLLSAFSNKFNPIRISFFDDSNDVLSEPNPEHYVKWRKLRLYDYYLAHKNSVDKYGCVLSEMQMNEEEISKLKEWLNIENARRIKEIEEVREAERSKFNENNIMFEKPPYFFYSENETFLRSEEELKLSDESSKNKQKSLVRRLFSPKNKK